MSEPPVGRTLVLGLGSPLQGDDGVGPAALARLCERYTPDDGVEPVDGGTDGLALLPRLEDAERVLVIDAVRSGAPPGTRIVLRGDEVPRRLAARLSPHEIDLAEVLALAELRGRRPRELVVLGIEPERVEMRAELSPAVAASLDPLVEDVRAQLEAWGHRLPRRAAAAGLGLRVRGVVQGVGFRPWVRRVARSLGLSGSVRNESGGVTLEAWGPPERLRELVARLEACELSGASVLAVERLEVARPPPRGFEIAPSASAGARHLVVASDAPPCRSCLRELADPTDRRYRYPFLGCAACGPRYTITRSLPWDRARTSLADFPPCADCAREMADPEDRRFHAEAVACAACGPRLRLVAPDGRGLAEGESALEGALQALRAGALLAVHGVGGFHLACDAAREEVVGELRTRKQRERKPFAVMAPDRAAALQLAELDAAELALLESPERPIVLARRRPGAAVADAVAPGSAWIGLLLPYAPLHQLLLQGFGRPLVLTSGNRSGEPIAHRVPEALERLAKTADAFLVHDREIVAPCDDSVAAVVADAPVVLRRSRGFVPRPILLRRPVRRPVLACGGQTSHVFCLAVEDRAVLSAHHGDLDVPEAFDAFERDLERMLTLLAVEPEVIAHDLHPLYRSTLWALARPAAAHVGVQHHHAHLASALAEHGLAGPALGLAWDGTGYGPDGAAWGGELLLADAGGFERLATFRPLRLPGGEAAIREVWRVAVSLLEDACEGEAPWERLAGALRVPTERMEAVRRLLRRDVACVPAHGVGRLFDAVGALVLGRADADFQGEVAMAWNSVAERGEAAPYPFALDLARTPWELDWRPLARAVLADHLAGRPPGGISARFHATLGAMAEAVVREASARTGDLPLVLTGGCFQNALLATEVQRRLARHHSVLLHRRVPPGDGGIALGQALVADERLARGEAG